jgi:methionine-rich copper-binding protein CopC
MFMCAAPLVIAACSSKSDDENGPKQDVTPPTIVGQFPASGAPDVTRSGPFWVAFSEPMNPYMFPAGLTFMPGPVDFNTSWKGDTLIVTPTALLMASTTYTITIAGSVEDAHGNDLGSAHPISFTTTSAADETPPEVISTDPASGATGVSGVQTIKVTFSEPMNMSATQNAIETSPVPNDVWTEWEGLTMEILHSAFPQDSLITVMINTNAADLSGNHLASPFTFSFRTAEDHMRPHLVSASPANGATGVSTNQSQMVLTFSEPMDQNSFNMPAEYMDARINQAIDEPTWNEDFSIVTVPFAKSLFPGCTYWVRFLNVKDAAGNLINPNPTPYQFTTAGTVSFYPVKNDDTWHFIGSFGQPIKRFIQEYNQSSGTFDEVFMEEDGKIQEVSHLTKTSNEIQSRGADSFSDGVKEFSMFWDHPITYIKLPPDNYLGQSWSYSETSTINDSMTASISGHFEIEANKVDLQSESMNGTFKGCCVHHFYVDIFMYVHGNLVDEGHHHQIMWLAPGVGPVQIVNADQGDTLRVVDWSL